ncbi:hydrogen peroxide-inducible genes activator [Aliikangiella coralliicola]|uniref:Hydrogen peroxide-inducible genes activator n=1 Tax=Aliikangiella coralliicola TaxID=2592383 RepID=A0A545U7N3_9GAMM|nr:hydrogen peroxide-inducible genes activator [Aliikangiella coralliicola]TQV85475.1 hydrogen peroxide-inducible genes activator [Aliikangiella coralliicola]
MTLNELRYVVAVAQTQHFSKAADSCHVSQPSLSIAIRKLEEELGITIFQRGKRQVEVTPEGETVVQQAQKVIEEAEKLTYLKTVQKNPLEGVLKIGAIFTIGPYLFPSLIPYIRQHFPEMPLHIDEDYTENLRKKLLKAEIDIAVLALPFSDPAIETLEIYDEDFMPLFYEGHPFGEMPEIKVNDVPSKDLLMLGKGNCFRDQVIAACPTCSSPTSSVDDWVVGSSLETIRHMVAMKLGITVMPVTALAKQTDYPGLDSRPFAEPVPKRRIVLAWRSSFPRKEAVKVIAESLQQALAAQVDLLPLKLER